MNDQIQKPEFDLTKHEIDTVNLDQIHVLGREWLNKYGNLNSANQQYLSPEENEKAPKIAGSDHNSIVDFDHSQEPIMVALSMASDYAHGTKRKVEKMYHEAYAAHSHPKGPDHYFAEQHKSQKVTLRSRLLGRLASRNY